MATELSADVIDRWQGLLSDFHADSKEVARHRERDARRAEVVKEMQAQLVEFLEPGSTTPEFRAVFDKKTRHEWDVFGLKGLSGAMFLNKLVKHIPDQAELASQLREVLPAPSDESRARHQLGGFLAYLDGLIASGAARRADLQPTRAVFFVSSWWHVQDPEAWPPYYASMRKCLRSEQIFEPGDDLVENYLLYRELVQALAHELSLGIWNFEHVAWRLAEETPLPAPTSVTTTPSEPRRRVWLVAPGHGAKRWEEFHTEGIAAIG